MMLIVNSGKSQSI